MMKKTVISASIAAILMMANQVSAASMSPELKVKGQMAVPSCEVSITNDGVFELGKLSNGLINSAAATALAKSQKQLVVNCEAETFLNFTVVDNREGTASATGSAHFGLGASMATASSAIIKSTSSALGLMAYLRRCSA